MPHQATCLCIFWLASPVLVARRALLLFHEHDVMLSSAPRAAQVFDGYIVKYFASVVALLVYAAPLYFRDPGLRASQADLTQAHPTTPKSPGLNPTHHTLASSIQTSRSQDYA